MLVVIAALGALLLMEPYSALIHRVVWHGPLWKLHSTHHVALERPGLVRNDLLSASHAPISMGLVLAGVLMHGIAGQVLLGLGVGMTAYGMLYLVFHDGMVHGRLPVGWLLRFALCRAWKTAHEQHHSAPHGPWGFFASPLRLHRGSADLP